MRRRGPRWILSVRPAVLADLLKKLLRVRRVEVATETGVFWIDPVTMFGQLLLDGGMYEPLVVSALRSRLGKGSVFIDVGANEGYFTVLAARLVGDEGRVVAVEPQARMQNVILRNLELNQVRNVVLLRLALAGRSGDLRLFTTPGVNTGATGVLPATRYSLRAEHVTGQRLADVWPALGIETCDLMKVDVEGFESDVIDGARPLLERGVIRALIVEFHQRPLSAMGSSREQVETKLEQLGYERADVVGDHTTLYVHRSGAATKAAR